MYFEALLDKLADDALLYVVVLQWEERHNKINEMFINDPRFPETTCTRKEGESVTFRESLQSPQFKELLCVKPKYSAEERSAGFVQGEC